MAQVRNIVQRIREGLAVSLSDASDFILAIGRDAGSCCRLKMDEKRRLKAVFWASSDQVDLALKFGDVAI